MEGFKCLDFFDTITRLQAFEQTKAEPDIS
uniref:Uncharacterized protein n=1 Tax=Anguilla anguilla TaxID=7936 RepID=A0A0E9XDZ3_ANGAN